MSSNYEDSLTSSIPRASLVISAEATTAPNEHA
jgi:hypothetical protein